MDITLFYIFVAVFAVSLLSFLGVYVLSLGKGVQAILIYLVSFAAGALFGDVFFHLLPEIVEEQGGFLVSSALGVLGGILTAFILETFLHWRHCHEPISKNHHHPLAVMNLFGDAVHNFIDGIIIAASFFAGIPAGIATTLAVLFHELPQEIGDGAVLLHAGMPTKRALVLNFITALAAFVGAAVALVLTDIHEVVLMYLLPFAVGNFLYIAGADLIPQLHRDMGGKKAIIQTIMFVLGIAVMAALLLLE